MKTLSKEYKVNKIAASLVPNVGHFKEVANSSKLLVEKIKLVQATLNSDTLDEQTKKSLQSGYSMLAEGLKWMSVGWE